MSQDNSSFEAFARVVESRRAVKKFDSGHYLDDAVLTRLFETVILSPSSFNLQHWRFVVIRDPDNKKRLRAAAMGQAQVEEASAVVIVIGRLSAHRDAARIYSDAPPEVQKRMVPMVQTFYEDPAVQRDEAIRGASLAAMTLMHAAAAMGLASGPMIGFDPEKVSLEIGLDRDHFPVMLVVLGKQAGVPRQRPTRLPLSEVVMLESFQGTGLGDR